MSDYFLELLEGEFNNFQQVWQQKTDTPSHVVLTDYPHKYIHQVVKRLGVQSELYDCVLMVKYYLHRDKSKVAHTELLAFVDDEMLVFECLESEIVNDHWFETQIAKDVIVWAETADGTWYGNGEERSYKLTVNGLDILDDVLFANANSQPSKLLKCRFFSGWIEIPDTDNPEIVYRFPNLRLHDQGALVQLVDANGKLCKYTVELTQLVFGHTIFIMKLAIYELPAQDIDYNSHSVAYTWTNPEAQRIGINLRYIISGWTLENRGLGVSKNP